MALLICAPDRSNQQLAHDLSERLPNTDIRIWPEIGRPEDIVFAVLWKHPKDLLSQLPNLKAVSSLGAGIEHLVDDPTLASKAVPVGRMAGPKLALDMATWLIGRVVADWRVFDEHTHHQSQQRWVPETPRATPVIGILGMGQMGGQAALSFSQLGFQVLGFSQSGHGPKTIPVWSGDAGLEHVASQSDYLICLLPLTPQTQGILNKTLMASMKAGSVLINVGRGGHLHEQDLLDALSKGKPRRAILDVFQQEPLPAHHPFWKHEQIVISPHCASITDPQEAAERLAQSYEAVLRGEPPLGEVDLALGY